MSSMTEEVKEVDMTSCKAPPAVMMVYEADVLANMRDRESRRLPHVGASPQLSMRTSLVDFLTTVCEQLEMTTTTTHLAVYLMDRFMDAHSISANHLKLATLTCVWVAGKYEERDVKVPRLQDLNAFVHNSYSNCLFNKMEIQILRFFQWNIGMVTAANFFELFLLHGVQPGDSVDGCLVTTTAQYRRVLSEITAHYLNLSLRYLVVVRWRGSRVAAASLACGRLHCRLEPTWPEALSSLTGYSWHTLQPTIHRLQRLSEGERRGDGQAPHISSLHKAA